MRIPLTKNPFHRVLLYGVAKRGKTITATSLPYEEWGDAVYIASDVNSEFLDGIRPQALKHIRIEKPNLANPEGMANEYCSLAMKDWAAEEGVGVVIWDTMSQTAKDILKYVTSLDRCSHVSIGRKGTPGYISNNERTDYNLSQSAVESITGFLFQQKCHVIVVAHAGISIGKAGDPEGSIVGGPETVGVALIRDYPRPFSSVIYQDVVRGSDGKPRFIAHCSPHGIWQAGVRSVTPMPDVTLSYYPVEFWQQLDAAFMRGDRS